MVQLEAKTTPQWGMIAVGYWGASTRRDAEQWFFSELAAAQAMAG